MQNAAHKHGQQTTFPDITQPAQVSPEVAKLPRSLKARLILEALKNNTLGTNGDIFKKIDLPVDQQGTIRHLSNHVIKEVFAEFAATLKPPSPTGVSPKYASVKKADKPGPGPKPGGKKNPPPEVAHRSRPTKKFRSPAETAASLRTEHFWVAALALSAAPTVFAAEVLKIMPRTYAQKAALALSDIESGRQDVAANTIHIVRKYLAR